MAVDSVRNRPTAPPKKAEGAAPKAEKNTSSTSPKADQPKTVDAFDARSQKGTRKGTSAALPQLRADAGARTVVLPSAADLWGGSPSGAGSGSPSGGSPSPSTGKSPLSVIGLTQDDLAKAGQKAAPYLQQAADDAAAGNNQQAVVDLRDAAKAGVPGLAEKAIVTVAGNLPQAGVPGAARQLLTDPSFVHQLVNTTAGLNALGELANGNVGGGLNALVADKPLRDAALNVVGRNADVQAALGKLGFNAADLDRAGDAAPALLSAAEAAGRGDYKGAIAALQDAAPVAVDLAVKGINSAAKQLSDGGAEGVAKSLLGDPSFTRQLLTNPGLRTAVGQLASGDIAGGIKSLAGNDALVASTIQALSTNKDVQAGMAKLGLTVKDLQSSRGALPYLAQAGIDASRGAFPAVLKDLQGAADNAPALVEKGILSAAGNLPDGGAPGIAKSLLTNPALVKAMVEDKGARAALGLLADGKIGDGLKALTGDGAVTSAAIDALAANPDVKAGLDKLGVTVDDLKASSGALPELVQAGIDATAGDFKASLKDLASAANQAPALIEDAIMNLGGKLQDTGAEGIAKSLLTDPDFVSSMVEDPGARDAIGQIVDGKVGDGLKALASDDAVSSSAINALATNATVQAGMGKLGLTVGDLQASRGALPDLVDAARAAAAGDFPGALQSLESAAGEASPIIEKAIIAGAGNLPATGPAGIARSILTDPAAVKQLVENQELHDQIGRLAQGDLSALKDMALNQPVRDAIADAVMRDPQIKAGLDKFGLTPQDVKGSFASIGDVAQAAQALAQGDFQGAVSRLKDAAVALPPSLVEKAITRAAGAALPATGAPGVLRSLLTDKGFVQQLVENPALHDSFNQLLSGDIEQGLKGVLANDAFRNAAAAALANNAGFMQKLAPFGISTAADLSALGKGMVDLLKSGEGLARGDYGAGISDLGAALQDAPQGLKDKVLNTLGSQLHLPPWAGSALVGLGDLIGNKDVAGALGSAIGSFTKGDAAGFVSNLARAGRLAAQEDPALATSFLDSLSHLPGSMGKLFADHELNQMIVNAGTVGDLFQAVEKASRGDVGGALNDLSRAATAVLTSGQHFNVMGQELPFGMDGVKAVTKIFERFYDALPQDLKDKIMAEAAKAGVREGLNFIPMVGPVINGVADSKQLWDDLHQKSRDNVTIALDAAQLGLDVAGVVPGLNAVTPSLKLALGTIRVIKGAADLIGDVQSFKQAFTGIGG